MQRNRVRILLLLVAAMAFAIPAAAKPNFSGTWKIDASKSSFGEFPAPPSFTRTVKHEDPSMEVSTTQSGPQGEFTSTSKYTTDGKESTNQIFGGAEAKTKATWDGDVLVVTTMAETPQGSFTTEEHWSLSADGKTTTVDTKFNFGGNERNIKVVLNKQ